MTDYPVFINPPAPLHPGDHLEAEQAHDVQPYLEPVPVALQAADFAKPVPTEVQAAEFGPWVTWNLTATQAAFKLLPYDQHRLRAVLIISGTGPVFVGSKAQCQASPVLGGQLNTGNLVELRNKNELWVAPDGTHTVTVTVLAERYEQ